MGPLVNSIRHLGKQFLPVLYNLFQEIRAEELFLILYEASIAQIPKPRAREERKLQTNDPHEHMQKLSTKY